MADRKWRQDAGDYMDDNQYQQYLDKKSNYAKSNQIDPSIAKLAESYRNRPTEGADPYGTIGGPADLDLGKGKVEEAQQSIRNATGYSDGGEVDFSKYNTSPEDFEESIRQSRIQGTKPRDLRRDIDVDEDDINPSPKKAALRKFLKK